MIRLPTFTFLNGPNGCGKTAITQELCAADPGLCHMSFAEPLRMALLAIFHPDQLFDSYLDLRKTEAKASTIPGTNRTYRHFMIELSKWMKTTEFNPYIFADIAQRRATALLPHWPRFIFDDCRFAEEPAPFSLAYGSQNCLIVSIDRNGCSWDSADDVGQSLIRLPGFRHVALSNNRSLADALAVLESVLGTFAGPIRPLATLPLATEPEL